MKRLLLLIAVALPAGCREKSRTTVTYLDESGVIITNVATIDEWMKFESATGIVEPVRRRDFHTLWISDESFRKFETWRSNAMSYHLSYPAFNGADNWGTNAFLTLSNRDYTIRSGSSLTNYTHCPTCGAKLEPPR